MADDDWVEGARRGVKDVVDSQQSLYDAARQGMVNFQNTAKGVWVNWVTTGKLSINDIKTTFLAAMAEMAYQRTIGSALSKGLEWALNGMGTILGGSAPSTAGGNTGAAMQFTRSANGNVFSGGGIGALSGGVYDRPTYFGFDRHVAAFANGGVLGEVPGSYEAVMPLRRTPDGRLGVAATSGSGGGSSVSHTHHWHITMEGSSGDAAKDEAMVKGLVKQLSQTFDAKMAEFTAQQSREGGVFYGRG